MQAGGAAAQDEVINSELGVVWKESVGNGRKVGLSFSLPDDLTAMTWMLHHRKGLCALSGLPAAPLSVF